MALFKVAPFEKAHPSDKLYGRYFCHGFKEFETYFKINIILKKAQASADLKELLFSMLQKDPSKRPSI